MKTDTEIKKEVREAYAKIASQSKDQNQSSCCGAGASCSDSSYTIFSEDYAGAEGYNPEADLGLGCGLPNQFAGIREGDTVLDLGSGAGNDVFVARAAAGEAGRVVGVDMTPEMIDRARENNEKLGYKNVEFRLGEIENLPLGDREVDVVISNCVLNLVPDKDRAFAEIYRVLKAGGSFSISDVVLEGELPPGAKTAAELYAGCVSGALQKKDYLAAVHVQGFADVTIASEKNIDIPDEILEEHLSKADLANWKSSGTKIKSITLKAVKPSQVSSCGCAPGNCC